MSGIRIRYLSFFFGLIAVLSLLNVIYSYYLNLYLNLNTYYLSFISSSIIGFIFYRFEKIKLKVTFFDKILTVFFGYLLLPIILSLPFYFSIYNLTFLNAFFEAISGFTSTGFTIFDNIKHIDQSLILWRSSIQWIGGLYFLFSIIYLIDIYDENFKKTLTHYLSFNSSEIFKQSFKIFLIYFGLTLLIFVVLNFLSIRSFNSFNLALTIISSGGFLPTNNLSDILKTDAQIIIFSLLLLFSFFSIFFFYNLIFIKKKNINFFYEDVHLIFYYFIVVSIFFFFFFFNNFFLKNFFSLNFDQSNLNIIYLILVIIGGSFFSTSSGLRFIKVYSLFKYSINQILSFSRPKNIFMNKLIFTKINFDFKEINKYFLTILIFVISLFTLTLLLSFSLFDFESAFKLSVLTIMNTVNSSAYGLSDFDFYNLNSFTKNCLILFMIIGRIELLTILIIIKNFLFKD